MEALIPQFYWNNTTSSYDTSYQSELVYLNSSNPIINNAGENLFTNKMTLKDVLFDGQKQSIIFSFTIWGAGAQSSTTQMKVRLQSLTEATYNYFNSYAAYQESSGDPFSEPVQVFSNVASGFGIFGGQSVFEVEFN